MKGVNSLLDQRLTKKGKDSKTAALAKKSATGDLSGFSGIFGISELTSQEKDLLHQILFDFGDKNKSIKKDLTTLISISSEIKAINNQAALLHGERIKKAQEILKNYKDGAFTAWLLATYGNRQTPYNFMQYYEFYSSIPPMLRPQIEEMPRQAIYTLASREGPIDKKVEIVEDYKGQTKDEILRIIRETFPLSNKDKRKRNYGEAAIQHLEKVYSVLSERKVKVKKGQKKMIAELLESITELLETL